jgi:predicted transcriptional regulator of viral defense system
MANTAVLNQFGIIPIDTAALKAALDDYKSPKDKITTLEQSGLLIRLKRGLFVVAPMVHSQPLSKELIANHIYGPSYISLQTALSFYGLIPERVHTVCSMTTKRSSSFINPLGNFDYITVPAAYFAIGIRQEIVNNNYAYLIATPEKALCDMIVETKGLKLQSIKAIQNYLEEDLRVDLSIIEHYDVDIIYQCMELGSKKRELTLLYKLLKG